MMVKNSEGPGPAAPDGRTLTVIVPVLDEAACLPTVLAGLLDQEGVDDILVVDGGSRDGSQDIVRSMGVALHEQHEPGFGPGLHEAFRVARGDLLCIVDADGSHDWGDIPAMRRKIAEGYDYVLASRYMGPFRFRGPLRWPWSSSEDDDLVHEWGNLAIVAIARALHGYPLHDVMMGLQMWRREVLDAIDLCEPTQAFEAEFKLKILKAGFRMAEIPTRERPRIGGEAKLNAVTDGFATGRILFGLWLRDLLGRRNS